MDQTKLNQLLAAIRPEFTNVDWTALARKVLVENPQTALRELPSRLQGATDLLMQYNPGGMIPNQPPTPPEVQEQLLGMAMDKGMAFAPMGMTKAIGLLDTASQIEKQGAKQISENLESLGIKADLFEKGDLVTLSRIIVPKEKRNTGLGTEAMQQIIDYADQTGKRVALSPSSDFGGNKERLKEFYKRFGFVENKGRNKDFTISESMYREPQ